MSPLNGMVSLVISVGDKELGAVSGSSQCSAPTGTTGTSTGKLVASKKGRSPKSARAFFSIYKQGHAELDHSLDLS